MVDPDASRTIEQIGAALAAYGIGALLDVSPLEGPHLNDPHVVSTDRGRFLVKLLRPEFSGLPALEARHAFIEHLVAQGLSVPRLIRTRGGATHLRLDRRVLEVYEFVEGRPFQPGDADDARAAGEALASLHLAAAGFRSPSPGRPRDWLSPRADLERLGRFEEQMRTYVPAPEAFAPIERVKSTLRGTAAVLGAADLLSGMIHGDFLPGNLIYLESGAPVITDFDYCHQAPLIFDVATAIIGFAEPGSPELGARWGSEAAAALTAGYQSRRPLSEPERDLLDPAIQRVLVHLLLGEGASPEEICRALDGCPNAPTDPMQAPPE